MVGEKDAWKWDCRESAVTGNENRDGRRGKSDKNHWLKGY